MLKKFHSHCLIALLYFCEDEPGKQVKSAVRLKNTSRSHVAFKVLVFLFLCASIATLFCDSLHWCPWFVALERWKIILVAKLISLLKIHSRPQNLKLGCCCIIII